MNIENNGTLSIATGVAANSKSWKNKKIQWSELAKKLTTAYYTGETYKEFMALGKSDQSKIKDVGGFVGGYLRGGRRKPANVVNRQVITLDIDYGTPEFWDVFTLQYDCAALIHGTHKHSEDTPKYRLVIPLNREVTPDEYVAISRQIAGTLYEDSIDLFDPTTFQPCRLMFWPSSPKDVEFYSEFQDGEWLDADEVLETYQDWTDSSLWPTAAKAFDDVKNAITKQEDPCEKRGLIGAFCRTYTITEILEQFLSEEYEHVSDDRYTYLKGSAAGGLITYDDKFAYSHHGTDPSGGQLCNAFDMVRIHRFGHLDEGTRVHKNEKLVSFKKMEEFVMSDKNTKSTIASENINSAKYDFQEDIEEEASEEEQDLDWAKELEVDAKGKYLSSANNLNLIFANDPRLKDTFMQNDFDGKRYVTKSLPWRKVEGVDVIKNVDYSGVRNYIESIYAISGNLKIDDSLALEFEKKSFHPIKKYLNEIKWDGIKRVDTFLIEYFGATDDLYNREALRKMMCAAVARVFNPGTKFDLVLTLIGAQGTGKSTLVTKLGKGWSSDTFMTVSGNAAFEQLQGAWLIEMAELSGLRKAEVESVKHFITKQEDTFRPAYARTTETYKRQCVFFGTTNNKDFLRDPSGNRRFMPIDIVESAITKSIFTLEDEEIDQLWAEAVHLVKKGEKLYLSKDAEKIARCEQKKHSEVDERQGIVEKYLDTLLPSDWKEKDMYTRRDYMAGEFGDAKGEEQRQYVCIAELWCECLGKEKQDMDRYKTRELNDILRGLEEWEQSKSTKNFGIYGKQKYYSRKKIY